VQTVRRKSGSVGVGASAAILFVGDAMHTGGGGRGRGSRCSEVRGEEDAVTEWWRGPMTVAAALPVAGCAPLL
jgi:hypothetical protein